MLPDFDGEQEKNMFLKKRKKKMSKLIQTIKCVTEKYRRVEN